MQFLKLTALALALVATFSAAALEGNGLREVQQQWAKINYQVDDSDKQLEQFESLIDQVQKLVAASPENAAVLTWLGISQASAARAKGGLGALDYAKQARKSFESAIAIDESVLDGTALFSLAALYHKVPGWPISFGDDDKAQALFKRALQINPAGIDANYFYAEFLADQGQYSEARSHLKKARQAAPRPQRPLADKGRRQAIETLSENVEKKLN